MDINASSVAALLASTEGRTLVSFIDHGVRLSRWPTAHDYGPDHGKPLDHCAHKCHWSAGLPPRMVSQGHTYMAIRVCPRPEGLAGALKIHRQYVRTYFSVGYIIKSFGEC